ncbi:parapinopsin-like [Bombyx mandarina]|uniref:Parapinopsin-like n=1 Tax=Bombyx mandarina TaxID=7092 RepID=A0A6J2JRQ1_BOMMA|nr:parapinopsin-like [Bombyx mandarina]
MTSFLENMNDTVTKAYDEGFPLLMPRWGYVASAFVLFLIGFFGFFLNLMVILLMFKDRQLWTPLNIILFNLVCSDFSVSVLGNPFTLISALFHRWIFGHTMCVLYGFFMALLGITSITTLTVISFERYLMVTRPLTSRHLSSKGAVLSIMFIWTYSLALTTPPLLGWGNYVNEAANISCSVNWHEQSTNTLTYIMFLFAMGQILPLSVITFSYVNIIRTLKRNSQRLGRVSRAEARATAMVFIMIIAFTVAWTPYSLFALMEQFATEGIVSPGASVIPALVAKSSICYDPLIYVGMNTQFRQSIKRIFGIHTKSKNSHTERGYNNTLMSPAHKLSLNNTKFNSETNSSTATKTLKDKRVFYEDASDVTNQEYHRQYTRNPDLCTIQENKTVSDTDRSGESAYDDSSSNRKIDMFGESCRAVNEKSPVLTIMDSERLLFSKVPCRKDDETEASSSNVYGNTAFEEHATDDTMNDNSNAENDYKNYVRHKMIRQSFSLDFPRYSSENKKRKLSIETKLESLMQPKSFLKGTISKLFDHEYKQGHDSFKSYLCDKSGTGNDEL